MSCCAFSSDERLLALGAGGGRVLWRHAGDDRRLGTTIGHRQHLVARVDFSPDGAAIVAGSSDGHSYVWKAPSLSELDSAAKAESYPR